jgi:Cu(I)/Ag(I) efflux system membrane fusion protein
MSKSVVYGLFVGVGICIGVFIGAVTGLWGVSTVQSEEQNQETKPLYWVAPMDANFRRDKPGLSPMGMELVPVFESSNISADDSIVTINSAVVNNLGVRTASVIWGPLPATVETTGNVMFDQTKQIEIHSRVDGWIEDLAVTTVGDPVKKGQLLLRLYSPILVNAQKDFASALASNNRLLINSARERLMALGIDTIQISRLEASRKVEQWTQFYAPQDGFITRLPVKEGQFIQPLTSMMTISKLDPIWVMADVFERQSHLVKMGQVATITLDYLPGKEFAGTIEHIHPELNQITRTLSVRMVFPNEAQQLKPGMFTRVRIDTSRSESVLSVPAGAVIKGGRHDRVILSLGNGQYKAMPVKTGIETDARIEILMGLDEDQQVVVAGQFLLDSESNIDAELERLSTVMEGRSDD